MDYRNSLNEQINVRLGMKAYGNMTNVEKELNKEELNAYKKFDNQEVSMLPGTVSSKRFADPRPQKHPSPTHASGKAVAINEAKIKTQEDRLQ